MNIFDSHAHLQLHRFDDDRDEVIERAKEAGVSMILNLATSMKDAEDVIKIAEKYDICYAAVGTHPCDVQDYKPEHDDVFTEMSKHPRVVMIGEIGLDYFHKPFDAEYQKDVLRRHLAIARKVNLPVSLHCRGEGCYDDLVSVLQEENAQEFGGIAHCFVGEEKHAKAFLEMGFYLGVGGIATYPKSQDIRDVLATVDPKRLLIETDSPFLAPQPKRGKRNEPAFVKHTAENLQQYLDAEVEFPFFK